MYYMKNKIHFTVLGEKLSINDKGDVYTPYDILNWQMNDTGEIAFVNVGKFNSTAAESYEFMVYNDSIFWNNPASAVSEFFLTIYMS